LDDRWALNHPTGAQEKEQGNAKKPTHSSTSSLSTPTAFMTVGFQGQL
jgi:hypothetical protein